jgi:hypothetical protein
MKRCKTHLVRVCVIVLASVPAYCQRGTFGIDFGQTSDKFDALSSVSGLEVGIDGQLTVLKSNAKQGRPSVVAGGEIRLPSDTGNHAREYAVFGGPRFQARDLSIGFNVQVRKIVLPTANVNNQFFARDTMELLELPLVLKYNFGSNKRAWVEVQGAPEFTPRFHRPSSAQVILPNPRLDHGYVVRGSVGYTFGKWYAKATYESRYFKFVPDPGNPNNLYNWKSNLISGGVGLSF